MAGKLFRNGEWREQMQRIVGDHRDVEILCDDGSKVGTSSLLLAAFSPVLRRTLDGTEEAVVLCCHDFSRECVLTALDFLTFGDSRHLTSNLAEDIYFFFQSLRISAFTIDGYKPCTWGDENTEVKVKDDSAGPAISNSPGLSRLSQLKGITLTSTVKVNPVESLTITKAWPFSTLSLSKHGAGFASVCLSPYINVC